MDDILKISTAIILSVGGSGAIIIGISKWVGEIIGNSIHEKQKRLYEEELEGIRNQYRIQFEHSKSILDQSKELLLRYSESQFHLYNDLWKSLSDLKIKSHELWEVASIKKLKAFSNQLKLTRISVEQNAILIEENHYQELINLISEFERFEVGKQNLIELRTNDYQNLGDHHEIRHQIQNNRRSKECFDDLLKDLASYFRKQIKGDNLKNTHQ